MGEPEDVGTRYEIHIQNEDGTSTGEIIVVYSNEGNDPAQVQDLVTRALAQVAQQQSQEEGASPLVIEDSGDQTHYYETTHIIAPEEQKPVEQLTIKTEEEQVYLSQEEPKQAEVIATLKPEQLELVMTQVENEFTEKAVPYKLKSVEPEELEDMQQSLYQSQSRRRTRMLCPPVSSNSDKENEVIKEKTESTTEGPDQVKVKEEEKVVEPKEVSCSYEDCNFVAETELEYQRHLKSFHDEFDPFQCSICMKKFKLELSLQIHLLGHQQIPALGWEVKSKIKKHYACPECDYQSFYKRLLVHHMKNSHEISELFTCEKCKVAYLTSEELDEHAKSQTHEENQWITCSLCGAASKNISQHLRRVHSDDKPYLCTECGYKCKFSGALKAHMLTHKTERAFKCDQCTYSARSKDQLKRHEVIHSTVKDQKCPHCKYATQTIYRLKKHMKIHTNTTKGYRCIFCDFVTHDKIILKAHKNDAHSKRFNMSCKECNLTFTTVQELKIHSLSVHKTANSWFCKFCDFSCGTRRDLGLHMQIHVGQHRYVCNICSYSCRQSNPFKRHLARHNKVKQFSCSICKYACTDKYDLEKHVITHSDVKMVSCPDCAYTCRYKAQLVRHKKLVHDDIRPYFCTFCNYTTKSPQNLKNHMHLHAEKKPHQCVLCDFSACQKSNLKRHMQTHLKKAQIVYVQ